ncbi:hypothetical protein BKA82DRAFT_1002074 [Pisolithus tinctorius]|uniref:Uncharacterized protein n=1 Tax=Pisolithus tinctorius Marx 270 TaxID=870435 RepID=A0A0C3J1C6_PISTI|nr:hypothetical protein BKA82DRAFT_1002074 [Pisolithus tinctorius]KIO02843.1 hypothetical protein M404DRAFT_1002074 [Pisolithus tinctorius Marx 270]
MEAWLNRAISKVDNDSTAVHHCFVTVSIKCRVFIRRDSANPSVTSSSLLFVPGMNNPSVPSSDHTQSNLSLGELLDIFDFRYGLIDTFPRNAAPVLVETRNTFMEQYDRPDAETFKQACLKLSKFVHTKPFLTQDEKEELVNVLWLADGLYEGYLVVDLILHTNYKSMDFRLLLYCLVCEVLRKTYLQSPIEGALKGRLEDLASRMLTRIEEFGRRERENALSLLEDFEWDQPWSQDQIPDSSELWPVSPVEHAFEQSLPTTQTVAQRRQSLVSAPPPPATRA